MKKTLQRGVLAACLAVLACEAESPLLPESEMLVVRGYLYSGEPVKDIQLTTTYAISSDDTSGQPINDAQVTLEKAGKIYPLALTPGDSGYYHYAGYDLTVEAADRFTITVARHGQVASATTEIPPAPNNVQISATEFVVSSMATPFDTSAIIVSWDNQGCGKGEELSFGGRIVGREGAAFDPAAQMGPEGGQGGCLGDLPAQAVV